MIAKLFRALFKWRLKQRPLEIYTDGGFKKGKGTWAFVVVKNNKVLFEAAGDAPLLGGNRLEFQAAIEALRWLSPNSRATIHSDSRLLIDSLNLWIPEWKQNDWAKKNGRPIPFVDQLIVLDGLNQKHSIQWKWIKSHSGNVHNERCDHLCTLARTHT